MNKCKNAFIAVLVGTALLIAWAAFILNNTWLGFPESSVLYLAAVLGAGCCYIGRSLKK